MTCFKSCSILFCFNFSFLLVIVQSNKLCPPKSISWKITDLEITLEIESNSNWKTVPDEYEVFTKLKKKQWKLHESYKVTKNYQTKFFGRLELPLIKKPIRIKARGKWLRIHKNNSTEVIYSQFVTNHTMLNSKTQSDLSFPDIVVNEVKATFMQFTFIIPSEVICLYNKYSLDFFYYIVKQKNDSMKCPQGNTINGEKIEIKKFVKNYYTKQNNYCNNDVKYEHVDVKNLTEDTKYNLFTFYKINKEKPKQSLVFCTYFKTNKKSSKKQVFVVLISSCIFLLCLVVSLKCFLQNSYRNFHKKSKAKKEVYSKYSEMLLKPEKYLNYWTLRAEKFSKIHLSSSYPVDQNKMIILLKKKRSISTQKFESSFCGSVQSTKIYGEANTLFSYLEKNKLTGSLMNISNNFNQEFTLENYETKYEKKLEQSQNYISKTSFKINFES